MNPPEVAVADYGIGNLLSVRRGFEHFGARVTVSRDPETILSAPRVILPGVGAFANGMEKLRGQGLDEVMKEVAVRGKPLLGICLGMQMLLDESEEYGKTPGLGLIHGRVVPVSSFTVEGHAQKIPHIGWNELVPPSGSTHWEGTLLQDVLPGEAVYFVHSFMASPQKSAHRVADSFYGGIPITAAIGRDNIYGCQFHPEKSGEAGLKILSRFLRL